MKAWVGGLLGVILLSVLILFGVSLVKEFLVWHHRQWDQGTVEEVLPQVRQVKRKPNELGLSGRRYCVRFGDHVRKITVMESIGFRPGDRIRVVYSPSCPRQFKVKLPSLAWILGWAIVYVAGAPLILYYGYLLFRGHLRDRARGPA